MVRVNLWDMQHIGLVAEYNTAVRAEYEALNRLLPGVNSSRGGGGGHE